VERPEGACDDCKDANVTYAAANEAQRRGLTPPPPVRSPDVEPRLTVLAAKSQRVKAVPGYEPGPVEEQVLTELASLPAAQRLLSTAASALKAGQLLDDDTKWSAHPALMRQLESAMGSLRKASSTERKGNLAKVASMSQRRTADTG
jgi:hypothetical protein